MSRSTEEVRAEFTELWGRMGTFWGVPPTTARVYGLLLSLPDGATADEIMEELGLSRGAVSMACRELRDWGLALTGRAEGTRHVLWLPETDLEKVIRNIVQMRKRREWDPILESLRAWIPRLASERSEEAARFRERLETIEGVVGTADGLAESFLAGGMVQKLGLAALVGAARRKRRRRTRR